MSWLDKFFSVFLGEEKKEEKADKPQEASVPKQSSFEQNKEYKKIEETKVYYEYPKGNFRFPLVPDEPRREGAHAQQRPGVRQSKPKIKQTIQPDVKKKPFKTEEIPSPIFGYHQDMRPKQTKKEAASVQFKSTKETTHRVTLLSEEAERERNIRQQMNIPSIRKENRNTETYSTPAKEKVDMEPVEITPFALQEELAYQDHVQSTMERLNDEPFIQGDDNDPVLTKPEENLQQEQQEHVPEHEPLQNINEQETIETDNESVDEPENVVEVKMLKPTPSAIEMEIETPGDEEAVKEEITADKSGYIEVAPADTPPAIEMEIEIPVEEEAVKEDITADTTENTEIAHEETQEEVPAVASEETKPPSNDLQHDQYTVEEEVKDDQATAEQVTDELKSSEPAESTNDSSEQQETPHHVIQEEVTHMSSQPKRSGSQTSTVPFNVMMLKSDQRVQNQKQASDRQGYVFPSLALLDVPPAQKEEDGTWVNERKDLLNATLKNFNVKASVVHVTQGPAVTRFEVHPEPGVKVNKITNLSDDIKLSLSAKDIRIEAPIPGKNTIGIEVPNLRSKMVFLREMIRSSAFRDNPSPLTAALGLDISGQPVVVDLQKMPHGLIAGATGSGKSVCINTILVSLMFKASPDEVKMLLIDPKMVELAPYNHIPHLVSPVITDAKTATAALKWVVDEMERRYELFAHSGVRDMKRFNELVKEKQMGEKLPYLVVVIDELADLMMVAPNEVEESICRIAQKARACGIHLLIATQRPSVDVITGLIKANIPTRIAFSVSSQIDSRTIIDMAGAEKLLGKGDMLFLENGSGKPTRLQGNFVSDREIDQVVAHVRKQSKPVFLFEQEELMLQGSAITDEDELFVDACRFAIEQNSASTSSLQRRFRIGYNRAARLIDMMEREGMISGAKGSKPREVLMTLSDLEQLI
ncbi:DNA translocase SftA [Bacillus pumilus]|nr:DNA translocase SftA [Bacillus pumilus]